MTPASTVSDDEPNEALAEQPEAFASVDPGDSAEPETVATEAAGEGAAVPVTSPSDQGVPRDERHDSIDPKTGLLTAEAVELRRQG